jgi:hypothetical protein
MVKNNVSRKVKISYSLNIEEVHQVLLGDKFKGRKIRQCIEV